MTERNWQEDMDKVNAFKHARSCVNIPKYQTMPSIEPLMNHLNTGSNNMQHLKGNTNGFNRWLRVGTMI